MATAPYRKQRVHVPSDMVGSEGQPWLSGRNNRAIDLGRNRLLMAGAIFLFAFSAIGVRLVELAIPFSQQKGMMQLAAGALAPVERADIVDRNGIVIATNLKTASLEADTTEVPDHALTVERLADELPTLDIKRAGKQLASGRRYVVLHNDLSPRQQAAINMLGIPGLRFVSDERRIYPQDNLTAHAVGYVDVDNNGLSGIERGLDERLRQGGASLQLTLDLRVQHALRDEMLQAVARFSAIGAAGLIMDVNNGEVLALASLPDFDPNGKLNNTDEAQFNRITLGSYEMGSTFKVFNTAMVLDSGTAGLNDVFDATDPIRISRFTINDFHAKRRPMSVTEIFLYSSNIGSAKMALQIGGKGQKDFLEKLGLMRRPEFELRELGEPSWPRSWGEISTMTISYGHGMAVSPLQMGVAVASLVNGGRMVRPTLVSSEPGERPEPGPQVVSETTSKQIRYLMRLVVGTPEGTGKQADVPGYEVAGKTGTADKQQAGRYRKDARISSFVGIFPASKPRYLIFVMLDEPKGIKETFNYATAGWTAAPTAGSVIRRIAPMLGVAPIPVEVDGAKLAAFGGVN
ncbi:MAG TPA: penicillin-binding protein 2 [Alphaproteobacteria bacterium]|nr:penicillin-binding protein 2 [Alphaproteobacteria bacterium]